jgi:hypothetical protein
MLLYPRDGGFEQISKQKIQYKMKKESTTRHVEDSHRNQEERHGAHYVARIIVK